MMWSTLAESFRENLCEIASDVLGTAQELEAGRSPSAHPQEDLLKLKEENQNLKRKIDLIAAKRTIISNGDIQGGSEESILGHGYSSQNQKENINHFDVNVNNQPLFSEVSDAQQNTTGMPLVEKVRELELQIRSLQKSSLDLDSRIQEKDQAYVLLKHTYDQTNVEIRTLQAVLDEKKADLANADMLLQREQKAKEEVERECQQLKIENQKLSMEISGLKQITVAATLKESSPNYIKDIQERSEEVLIVHNRKLEELKETVRTLNTEKSELQIEGFLQESEDEQESEIKYLKEKLEVLCSERDKALRDLNRLRQHLLEKEQADSEKMDQDNEQIAELQALSDASSAKAKLLEQALAQALAKQEDDSKQSYESLQKANKEILVLKERLSSCIASLESKNVEILNLQTVLGQYYAESEAKERLLGEFLAAKKEIALISENLKVAKNTIEVNMKERNDLLLKISYQEDKVKECEQKMKMVEEETLKLRRALEQSITRLNRMSSESDYLVDRRIVIKLLITYFQRQHSREVLDLMVRMLGFSEEDKQIIGLAHQAAGRGVVRGVLGIPGRVVGGLLKTASSDPLPPLLPIENQSFADLWIDFLLKESKERERKTTVQEASQGNGEWSSVHV